jgi:transcriptional regulator with XRE-family HTH domain
MISDWGVKVVKDMNGGSQLGEALRASRLNHVPPLTLEDIGSSDSAPRTWSHSHLSKVERGHEIPTPDLVEWYAEATGSDFVHLLALWELETGRKYVRPAKVGESASTWSLERLEMELDLRGENPTLTHTRDLIALQDADSYWLLYDTKEVIQNPDGYGVQVDLGGELELREALLDSTLEKAKVNLGRKVEKGSWHRIRVVHTLPGESIPPYLDFSLRSAQVREVLMTVRFGENKPIEMIRFAHVFAEEMDALLANPSDFSARQPEREQFKIDEYGTASTQFQFPQAGFHYGVVWVPRDTSSN